MKTVSGILSRVVCLVAIVAVLACEKKVSRTTQAAGMVPPAFWVWHRSSPLKPSESEFLRAAGVHKLYWQATESRWKDGRWRATEVSKYLTHSADLEVIPVFRLTPESAFLGSPGAAKALAEQVRDWSGTAEMPVEIQIDFDCPARLLDRYAGFLEDLGRALSPIRVSATALASWPRAAGFEKLADSVCSLSPMFYDLTEDRPQDVAADRFQAMTDPAVLSWIRMWANCPKPWHAGLPNFERLSVFAADGKLVGHIRAWDHDPVFFHPALKPQALGNGVTLFQIEKATTLYGTALTPAMKLVHRSCDSAVLDQLRSECRQAGASGVVFFALPGPGIRAAFTPAHLSVETHPASVSPVFTITPDGAVTLKNPGPSDIPTGVWELEIRAARPASFTSGQPGEFVESSTSGGLPPEMADALTLRFSRLSAGASITSGPVVRMPDGLTWKLQNVLENRKE
jgi:hypothetical protein